jgi:transcriptional regulator with XRE-family HTH domain
MLNTTGEKIKTLRNIKGFTQDYMAKQLQLSQKAYSKIETNEQEPAPLILQKIANVFNVTPEFIQNFSPAVIFNNNDNKGNVINVHQIIVQTEQKAVQAVKDVFAEMKETFGNTTSPKKPQKKASPKK